MAGKRKSENSGSRSHNGRVTAPGGFGGDDLSIFDGLCREVLSVQGRDIARAADPLEAELWASHLLGMFGELPLIGEVDTAGAIAGRLISVASRQSTPQSLACLRALAAVGSPQLASKVRRALATRKSPGKGPDWITQIGTAKAVAAWRASDLCGDQDSVMVSFNYDSSSEHCVMVLIDHVLGGIAKDASVLPCPMSEVLGTWEKDPDIVLRDEPVGMAAGRILAALAVTRMTVGASTTEDLTDAAALIEARLKPIAVPLPEVEPLTDSERAELVRSFLSGKRGARFVDDPAAWFVLDVIVAHRCGLGLDPLRWSGGAALFFLLDWIPRKVTASEVTLDRAPEILDAWVAWAGPRACLPKRSTAETRAVIAEVHSEAIEALRDETRWGPAKQIAMSMVADGVDVSDGEEVDAWLARHSGSTPSGSDLHADPFDKRPFELMRR